MPKSLECFGISAPKLSYTGYASLLPVKQGSELVNFDRPSVAAAR